MGLATAMVGAQAWGQAIPDRVPVENTHKCATVALLNDADRASFPRLKNGDYVQLLGYYSAGDGGGQPLVYDAESAETVDNVFVFAAPGGTGRFLALNRDTISILQAGAIANDGLDDSSAIQAAINAMAARNGGDVTCPSGTFDIANIYLRKGVRLIGRSGGIVREYGGSNTVNEGLATIFNVTGAAYGIIIGEPLVAPFNQGTQPRANGAILESCLIQGSSTGLAGILVGSADNYKGGGQKQRGRLVSIRGFTSTTAVQVVYDKSTAALGLGDGSFAGTAPVVGGCGMLILAGIGNTWDGVTIERCYYSVIESSGNQSTTNTFFNFVTRQCDYGPVVRSCRSYTYVGGYSETNNKEGFTAAPTRSDDSVSGLNLTGYRTENNSVTGDWANATLNLRTYNIRLDGTSGLNGQGVSGVSIHSSQLSVTNSPNVLIKNARGVHVTATFQTLVSQYDLVTENVEACKIVAELLANRQIDTTGTVVEDLGSTGTTVDGVVDFTDAGKTRIALLYNSHVGVSVDQTTEKTLQTYTLPAAYIDRTQLGKYRDSCFRITVNGRIVNNNADAKTVALKINGTTVVTSPDFASAGNGNFTIVAYLYVNDNNVTSAFAGGHTIGENDTVTPISSFGSNFWDSAITFTVTGTHAAYTSTAMLQVYGLMVEHIPSNPW